MSLIARSLRVGIAGTVAIGLLTTGAAAYSAPGAARHSSAPEQVKVDKVPTPRLSWYDCEDFQSSPIIPQCATVKVPLDYDDPTGPTTELAVLRLKATGSPAQRKGTLFVNPGGPGGAGTMLAAIAPAFLSPKVLQSFDVVGIDPRGVNFSDQVRCYSSPGEQRAAFDGFKEPFPISPAETSAFFASSRSLGKACDTTGAPLTRKVSTAEVARDMDLMRRAVGDEKLTYLGFSYGTALGQYYGNMFPDRVRAIVNDGVLNPVNWVGDPARPSELDSRIRSGLGAVKALNEIMKRCKDAKKKCVLGATAQAKWDRVMTDLKKKPVVIDDGGEKLTVTYAMAVGTVLGAMYDPAGWEAVIDITNLLYKAVTKKTADVDRSALRQRFAPKRAGMAGFPYNNGLESGLSVVCSDTTNLPRLEDYPAEAQLADKRAPNFGPAWMWYSAPCAQSTWTAQDDDAYRGPFNVRTASPMMFVGNTYDPATYYWEALDSAALSPGAYLVKSQSWGHTAYGSSACVTGRVDAYLLALTEPAAKACLGDVQPFVTNSSSAGARATVAGPLTPETVVRILKSRKQIMPPVANPWLANAGR
ncbi:alpha/beta fold hydrolase [Pilimelia columellifera]|uniref:Alpha/beta hydrolase n=1 Tax=Pilimelia columellifera subsp. columellifera TaxID=706583 RepID=A0ABN3NFN5_9ACTN